MQFKQLLSLIKTNLCGSIDKGRVGITPPMPLKHGLMMAGSPNYAMECLNEIIPNTENSNPQILVLPNSIANTEPFATIPELPQAEDEDEDEAGQLTVSQVAMATQRVITSIIDEPHLDEDKVNHLTLIQSVLGYASDANGGDQFANPSQFIEQMAELSSPQFLLQRIINPLTVMPELGSAIRLLQAYPGFSFGLIDHVRHDPETALQDKLKGRQLKMLKGLHLAHSGMIDELKSLIDSVISTLPSISASSLKAGARYKVSFDPESSTQLLMQLFGVTQAASQWKAQQEKAEIKTIVDRVKSEPVKSMDRLPLDLIILLDGEHVNLPSVSQNIYALAHHLWNTRSRTDNGVRLFVNWPFPWQEREQGKPMPLHGRILQGANAYYGPETDVIPAFRDVFGDRSPTEMNAMQDKTKAEIDIILKENDQKYAPNNYAGWIIDRKLFVKPSNK